MPTSDREETLARLRTAIDGVATDGSVSQQALAESERVEARGDADYAKAKSRALNILGGRAHAVEELRRKLISKEHAPQTVARVIERFTELGLLDDAAYAAQYVRAKREGRALSKQALRQDLLQRGVPDPIVSGALEEIEDHDEAQLAISLVEKKLPGMAGLPREKQERRLLGMLARRGFPPGISLRVVTDALDEEL